MVKALAACQDGDQKRLRMFLGLTILGGLTFLGMQAFEWTHLIHEGLTLTHNPWGTSQFGTTFFMTTGFHGCHVFGGVCYLSVILLGAMRGKYGPTNYAPVETVACTGISSI
jgi:heme/copper-type cytochrome/quinol oxidase subunit 3